MKRLFLILPFLMLLACHRSILKDKYGFDEVAEKAKRESEKITKQLPAPNSSSVCQSKESIDAIIAAKQNSDNLLSRSSFSEITKGKVLVLAGETHFNTSTNELVKLMQLFKENRGQNACVAFEFPNRGLSGVEFIQKFGEMAIEMKTALADSSTSEKQKDEIRAQLPAVEAYLSYFKPLTDQAISLGLKTLAVDHHDQNVEADRTDDERNEAMAMNLRAAVSNHDCNSILFFVGKGHLSRSFGNATRVQDFLQTKPELSNISINIQMTNETVPEGGQTWLCRSPQVEQAVIFKSDIVAPNAAIMPLQSGSPKWRDFDFTLLLP